jgi:GH15 family glucan-1,4-alpha-glucosidase
MTITTTPTRTALVEHSVRVLLDGQSRSGAFVASPTYPTYRFAWLRDGSFCADAVDRYGHHDAAARFHEWVCRTVNRLEHRVEAATRAASSGVASAMLPTRFELDGTEESGEEDWPNFQLDGYGTWLWAFAKHLERTRRSPDEAERRAVALVADYLTAAGDQPCYDCWEESVERRHASTLAACIAGLRGAARLLGDPAHAAAALELTAILDRDFVADGGWVKHDRTDAVDASLLWLALPFEVVPADDPQFLRTLERVATELRVPGGGVRRYLGDTFYGGGEWVLLTAWLAWALHATGDETGAAACLAWVEGAATPQLDLPEQTLDQVQAPDRIEEWVQRWGTPATPLLWSHAMYLVALDELGLR